MRRRKKSFTKKQKKRVFKVESRTESLMLISPVLDIYSVTIANIVSNSLSIPISIETEDNIIIETLGLIDSGAGEQFIDQDYADKIGLKTQPLAKPLLAQNIDGMKNKLGQITSFVKLKLRINGKDNKTRLLVTGLGKQEIILGFLWLNKHNPEINWKTGKFNW